MKRVILSIFAIIAAVTAYAQTAVYTFYFDEVWVDGRGEKNAKPGKGKITIYDNLDVVFEGSSSHFGNFRTDFKIQSASSAYDAMLYLFSGPDNDNCESLSFVAKASHVYYNDNRNPNNKICYGLVSSDRTSNESKMESLMSAFKNHTGIFSSFRSQADIELPLKIEGRTSNYSVRAKASGEETAYAVRSKTGKMVNETAFKDYEVSSDSYWADVSFRTEAAFLLKTEPNTTGRSRTATITVKAKNNDIATTMTVTQPAMVAKINRVWVEHNKRKGLIKGMKIHVEFETFNVRGITGYCNAYFSFANGNKLFDYNGNFRATDGQVCCPGYFTSGYDNTIYNNFELFMPYAELHINGRADCYFIVEVQVAGQSVASEKVSFNVY